MPSTSQAVNVSNTALAIIRPGADERGRRGVEAVDVGFQAVAERPTRHGVTDVGVHADSDVAFLDLRVVRRFGAGRASVPAGASDVAVASDVSTTSDSGLVSAVVSATSVSAVVSSLASSSLPPHAAAISEKLTSAASPYVAARLDGRVRICTPPEWILAECVTGVTLRGTLVRECFTA